MARTKRRFKIKSQDRTLNIFKNLYMTYKFESFSYVNIKKDERFFTDNQKTVK